MNTMELKIPAGHFNCKAVLSMLNINFNITLNLLTISITTVAGCLWKKAPYLAL